MQSAEENARCFDRFEDGKAFRSQEEIQKKTLLYANNTDKSAE